MKSWDEMEHDLAAREQTIVLLKARLERGWIGQVLYLIDAAQKPGVVAIIMLAIFVGWTSGWIPSPLTSMVTELRVHADTSVEVLDSLNRLVVEMAERNRVERLRECAPIADPALRAACLRPGREVL